MKLVFPHPDPGLLKQLPCRCRPAFLAGLQSSACILPCSRILLLIRRTQRQQDLILIIDDTRNHNNMKFSLYHRIFPARLLPKRLPVFIK